MQRQERWLEHSLQMCLLLMMDYNVTGGDLDSFNCETLYHLQNYLATHVTDRPVSGCCPHCRKCQHVGLFLSNIK